MRRSKFGTHALTRSSKDQLVTSGSVGAQALTKRLDNPAMRGWLPGYDRRPGQKRVVGPSRGTASLGRNP